MIEKIVEGVYDIGVNDPDLKLFESQYTVDGMSYNSYAILDDKIAIFDSVDKRAGAEWMSNVKEVLQGKKPDYLIVQHLEPDHSANIDTFLTIYPDCTLVATPKAISMLPQFTDLKPRTLAVKEGESLDLGKRTLTFVHAPMVHWPEVMVTYDAYDKILFSADAFGRFGHRKDNKDWDDEARRYYLNIVGKYGVQVQNLLKKAGGLDIQIICPLHGPVLTDNLGHYIELYKTWSSYTPEIDGVFIPVASIHGNTNRAAEALAQMLQERGCPNVEVYDLTRRDVHEAVARCFKYSKVVFIACSYDAGLFPPMERLLSILSHKAFKNRTVGLVQNGSWAPSAAKTMKGFLEKMQGITLVAPEVTIKTRYTDKDRPVLEELADAIWPITLE